MTMWQAGKFNPASPVKYTCKGNMTITLKFAPGFGSEYSLFSSFSVIKVPQSVSNHLYHSLYRDTFN